MIHKKYFLLTLLGIAAITMAPSAIAQQNTTAAPQQNPIEITATKSVEWRRDDNRFVARENVVVTQGGTTITADLLNADYKETPESSMHIWQLSAERNVTIRDRGNKATGDRAVYDVDRGVAILTGENLRLTSPDQIVSASEKMEYFTVERRARATGNAKVVRGKDTLSADIITAVFAAEGAASSNPANNMTGGGNIDRIEAQGNVVIRTPTETIRGARGVYRAATNMAEMTGDVRIERGPNILQGTRAEIDLNTNISRMFGGGPEGEGGRVRGIFYPGSEQSLTAPAPSTPPQGAPPETTPAP